MAWTQADLDALKAALLRGEKTVSYGDKTVSYHSLQELIQLLRLMEADVAATADPAGTGRFSRVGFSRS